jgi:hypothetical protein
MHRTAVDSGANAEREMNLFKSKLAYVTFYTLARTMLSLHSSAAQRSLTSEASAHKQTLAELQRTRTSLQYLRSTTQNELKRKDREVERVLDRWNKVADTQVKLSNAQSGLRCANFAVGNDEQARGKGLMEVALEQVEEARGELVKENEGFRTVLLGTANALQGMVYNVKGLAAEAHLEEVGFDPSIAAVDSQESTAAHAPFAHSSVCTSDVCAVTPRKRACQDP